MCISIKSDHRSGVPSVSAREARTQVAPPVEPPGSVCSPVALGLGGGGRSRREGGQQAPESRALGERPRPDSPAPDSLREVTRWEDSRPSEVWRCGGCWNSAPTCTHPASHLNTQNMM